MRALQSRARLAAAGLAIAVVTIIALAALILVDLERQAELNAQVAVAQEMKDHLYALRMQLCSRWQPAPCALPLRWCHGAGQR